MKVPVNPTTRVPTGELVYERAVDVTAGQRALSAVVDKYAQVAAEDQKKRELFDVQKLLVEETNNIQSDFEAKTRVQPLGAPNFTQQVNGEYNTRHMQMVKDLKDRGYSDDAINEFATRLGVIRSQYVAKAIDFQEKSNFVRAGHDAGDMAISLSQYVGANPSTLESGLREFKTALGNLNIDPVEVEQIYEQHKGDIIRSAQQGLALQHPDAIVGMFGLGNELTTTSPTNLPNGQQFDLPNYLKKMSGAEGTGKNTASSAVGFGQFLDSTWLETYKKVYGKTGETDAQILAKKKDVAVATRLSERFTNDNVQGLVNAGAPVNYTTVYLAHFLGLHDALKVINAHADETIQKLVTPASIRSNSAVFNKVHTAADMLAWAQSKMGVEVPQAATLKPIPKGWTGNIEDAIQELGMTAQQAEEYLRTGRDTRVAATTAVVSQQDKPAAIEVDEFGHTGIAAIDLATPAERLQMLMLARTVMNERENDAKAAQKAAHDEWLNNFYNGIQDGKLGQADIDAAYKNGQLTDFDERSKAQNIFDAKNKKNDDLDRFHMMITSGQKFNPFDKDAQHAADAGFDNAVKFAAKNGGDSYATPLQIGLREWQRIGIVPTQLSVMLRGGLVATDPQQVAAAASIASNMIKQNPNVFAGVEGGEDIGKAAANYIHYVDDLGMNATDAASKIASMNSPEFQAKVKANEPLRNQFITGIVGDAKHPGIDIEKIVSNEVLGAPGLVQKVVGVTSLGFYQPPHGTFSDAQKAEARQTYLELALDHFDQHHDAAAAQAYATRQMGRFYGYEDGRLLKYPATKAYPEIMGSRQYIFDQARDLVNKTYGLKINSEDVILQPTASGSTARAFRAGQAPPYEVTYVTHEDGQTVYHHIPGKVFIADVDEARRTTATQAHKIEVETRKRERAIRELSGQSYAH